MCRRVLRDEVERGRERRRSECAKESDREQKLAMHGIPPSCAAKARDGAKVGFLMFRRECEA
jgi:hypothetical protein